MVAVSTKGKKKGCEKRGSEKKSPLFYYSFLFFFLFPFGISMNKGLFENEYHAGANQIRKDHKNM